MRRTVILFSVFVALAGARAWSAPKSSDVTFHRDVVPVLQKHCQTCHRPGEAAPMSLLTYQETRPWAQAIREATLLGKMPPWDAEPGVGKKFSNERRLEQAEIEVLRTWADQGAPEGDASDAPQPLEFVEGWIMGEPDKVWRLPEAYEVPASGTIDYTYYIIPNAFPKDTWIEASEVRPDARSVVHHIIAYARPPESTWLTGYEPGQFFVPVDRKKEEQRPPNLSPSQWRRSVAGYAPGVRPETYEPGLAKLIPAGSDLIFELHYTADGTAMRDRSSVGIRLAKQPPEKRFVSGAVLNTEFKIPPNVSNHRVDAAVEFTEAVTLLSLLPHMHLRGKSFEYRAVYPTGESEILARVPEYDFNWQITYKLEKPIPIPKGTRIEATALFDNSPNNPANPDPSKEVGWGDQSWEEMMIGFFSLAVDMDHDPDKLYKGVKKEKQETAGDASD